MNDHDERVVSHNHDRSSLGLDRGNLVLERPSLNMEDSGDGNLLSDNKKERADNWGTRETEALIQVWKIHYVSLESIAHKRKVYKLVSDRLRELGHDRNIAAVQAKINKLKTLYRKNRPDPATGNKKPKWRFWEAVHEVVLQPLQRPGIRDRIGPAGITRETGPASPVLTDEGDAVETTSNASASHNNNNNNNNNEESVIIPGSVKEKPARAKKGNTSQTRRKLTVRHDEVLKKLLQEEDESHAIVQKLNASYQDTVNNLVQMQKKCNEKLVSLMTTFETHLNATQPQNQSPAPSRPMSNSSTSQSSSPYPGPMNSSPHQHQQFPNRSSHGSASGGLPQHYQRAQSHFSQGMPSCRPPGMLYQQQQPPPMMQPPPLALPPAPLLSFPGWNPLNIQSDTLISLLFPNLRMALHSMPSKDDGLENNSSIKDPDEELEAGDSE